MRRLTLAGAMMMALTLVACTSSGSNGSTRDEDPTVTEPESKPSTGASSDTGAAKKAASGQPEADPVPEGRAVATFAGGCFWCMEPPFEKLDGVDDAISGYTGGPELNPTYDQVARKQTGHTEAVRVIYDPTKVTYETLVETFWRSMDPTDGGGQFADRGTSYRPAIYTHSPEQVTIAEASKEALEQSKRFDEPIVVPILPAETFWVAEDYHQDYYKKNPGHYKRYSVGSGRVGFLKKHWGE